MRKNLLHSTLLFSCLTMALIACKKDKSTPVIVPTTVKEWMIPLSTKNENTPPFGRTETGTVNLKLLSDNSMTYTIAVVGLAYGDALVAAHIHVGDAISNGGVVLSLNPMFSGSNASGTLTNIRTTLADSLKDDMNELYFNVHSTQVPGGLMRGQLNTNIDVAEFVTLSGANEVPAVSTAATGTALIRVTSAKKIYIKLAVVNLEMGDTLAVAHIHKAAAGANGSVILGFYSSAADFGTVKVTSLTDDLYASLKTDAIYVNAHSTSKPGGLIRGQIR
jgi:hypothetical protein